MKGAAAELGEVAARQRQMALATLAAVMLMPKKRACSFQGSWLPSGLGNLLSLLVWGLRGLQLCHPRELLLRGPREPGCGVLGMSVETGPVRE